MKTPTSTLHTIRRHLRIWWFIAQNALQEAFVNRGTNALFLFGKALRLTMMLVFLFVLRQSVTSFAGYTVDQMFVFFLTYQIVNTITQIFYRGVYVFSDQVRSGEFDFLLAKPINPLFRALTGKPDINDTIFLIPNLALIVWLITQLNITITSTSLIWYLILLGNSFLIATALHIVVLVTAIVATEVDSVIWLYRDIEKLGQFPATAYFEPIRSALFFLVPIGMMVTIPVEVLLNTPNTYSALTAITVGISFFTGSLWLWRWSLKQYSSASS